MPAAVQIEHEAAAVGRGSTTATALTPSRSTCVACVPFGGGGTRRSRNASCRRSASRVTAGPILRLTNQRSPRRTSSARRLIATPLHSVGYRQQAHCHDYCLRSSSYVTAAQRVAAALLANGTGNTVTASERRRRLRSGRNSAHC